MEVVPRYMARMLKVLDANWMGDWSECIACWFLVAKCQRRTL